MYVFNFPEIDIEISNVDDRYYQALKIKEEVQEVQAEIENMNIRQRNGDLTLLDMESYAMELMDVVQACETALNEFDERYLDYIKKQVIRKNKIRNYYK